MDDDFQELEAELSRLRPAPLGRDFAERVERGMARRRALPGWLWAAMPAAAAFALIVVYGTRGPAGPAAQASAPPAAPAFEPVGVRDILVASRDEGYVVLADGWPARRLLEAHVNTIMWRSPRSAALLQWSVPREEIRIVPVAFH
jgi:hypothetical protein